MNLWLIKRYKFGKQDAVMRLNAFPEFLHTLMFQIEFKILLHNFNVDMDVIK